VMPGAKVKISSNINILFRTRWAALTQAPGNCSS
jgi:hypothetical protein